jgi:hypothetical protein
MLFVLSIFLFTVLALYRVCVMLTFERGPFDVFIQIRTAVYAKYGEKSWQFAGIGCPKCASFWLAWIGALWVPLAWSWYPLVALALSGAVAVIIEAVHRES